MTNRQSERDYLIVGAGAIGGTLAFHLVRAGHRVCVVDTNADHIAAIRRHGIIIDRNGARESVVVNASTPSETVIERVPRALMCVKGVGATETAANWVASRLAPDGFVVCVQNGLQVLEVARRVGQPRTIGAFVDFFADVVEPGVISDGGSGSLVVGELDGSHTERVARVVADLQAWGPARSTDNILGFLWSKLGFSAMLAATALADAPMADLIDRYRELMLALADEVFVLARHQQIPLESFDSFDPAALARGAEDRHAGVDRLVLWLRGQTKTRSGVWRDLAVHRRATEASGRYAELVELGETLGISLPHLDTLVVMLREVESGRRPMSEVNLEELRRAAAAVPGS